jgi:hypothetical protein
MLTALLGALAAAGCGEQGAPGTYDSTRQWLSAAVGDTRAAARIGRSYLAAHPGEQNLDKLLEAIDAALGGALGEAGGASQSILSALQSVVPAEYRRGESVEVQGWVLSPTEARVYAALALDS